MRNAALVVGAALLALLAAVAVGGPLLLPDLTSSREPVHYADTAQGKVLLVPPLSPGPAHPFGTDQWGYDILSLVVYGARWSLGISAGVALLRVGLGLGIALVIGGRRAAGRRNPLLAGWSSIPSFILIYFILCGINFNNPLPPLALASLQAALLVVFGLFGTVPVIRGRLVEMEGSSFVEAARSCGADRPWILARHVLPHLREPLVILFSHELVDVLVLLGKLGIFNMFVGGTRLTAYPDLFHSRTHEWAGLVGQYRSSLYKDDLWSLLFPLLAYLLLLSAFHLLSRGLEIRLRRRYRLVSRL